MQRCVALLTLNFSFLAASPFLANAIPNNRVVTTAIELPASSASANSVPQKAPLFQPAVTSSDDGAQEAKKKRSRNASQMEHNRIAQQKYREKKKMENSHFQKVIDELTLQVTLLKAVEVKASRVEADNIKLSQELRDEKGKVSVLEAQTTSQQQTIREQQGLIWNQEEKLKLQEQIIEALKDRLESSMRDVFDEKPAVVGSCAEKKAFCSKMRDAVKAALAQAKDVEGLQETLLQIPEEMVFKLVRSIFVSCRHLWPEVNKKMEELGMNCPLVPTEWGSCAAEAGHLA